ncbi:hypothetical protein [Mycobacterium paraterrae]|uniref:Uncharacterized protein n=1 Tax=Mycobacterium paraterrae TaxID=577492 RepID=A0ABY3VXS7_9MYCO|nr:hypothetical protein [Mycobacterium paraterrae]UMB71991.1 hypothetical protein MKK62_12645 [Mycobacterium paraterrae]
MSEVRAWLARRAAFPLTAVLITAAAMLWHHLPVPTQIYAPFDVHGSLGSQVCGRSLAVTVTGVRIAPRAKFPLGPHSTSTMSAAGLWVVVDATVSAVESSTHAAADLVVGANTYEVSLRPLLGYGVRIDPGLPQHGYWAFEAAPELIQPSLAKPFQLRVWPGGENRLSSRVVIDLDNRPPERADLVTVKPYVIGPGK